MDAAIDAQSRWWELGEGGGNWGSTVILGDNEMLENLAIDTWVILKVIQLYREQYTMF